MIEGALQGNGIIARGNNNRDQRTHFLGELRASFYVRDFSVEDVREGKPPPVVADPE